MRKRRLFKRLQAETISLFRLVRKNPATWLYPLVVLAVVVGIGMWGVTRVAQADVAGSKARAAALATQVACSLAQQLLLPAAPLEALAALVTANVSYTAMETAFLPFVRDLAGKVPSLGSVQLAPAGVVRMVYPPGSGGDTLVALGADLFAESLDREMALWAATRRSMTMRGPMLLAPEGHPGMRMLLPIFAATAGGQDGVIDDLGIPEPRLNPFCGRFCYDPVTGSKLWGFAAAEFHLRGMKGADGGSSSSPPWSLSSLEGGDYRYRLMAPDAPPGLQLLAGGGGAPVKPQEVVVNLPGVQWVLQLSPGRGTWKPSWYSPVVAALVLLAGAMAGALFAALVSRRQHQALLEALLPREVIRELVGGGAAHIGPRALQADTPADMLLTVLGALLEGGCPDLRDVLLVRTCVLRNLDIYQPLNLSATIKGANLDDEVTRALMRQLGTLPENALAYDNTAQCAEVTVQLTDEDDDNSGGGTRAALRDVTTLKGALALIVTSHPAAWYDTGAADVTDAASDAALPTADTECSLPSPLTSLAAISFGGGGGGGAGSGGVSLLATAMATAPAAGIATSQRQLMLHEQSAGTGGSTAAAAVGDVVQRQTRELASVNSRVLRTWAGGFPQLSSSASVLAFLQPLRGGMQSGCSVSGGVSGGASTRAPVTGTASSLLSAPAGIGTQAENLIAAVAAVDSIDATPYMGGGGGGSSRIIRASPFSSATTPLAPAPAAAVISNAHCNLTGGADVGSAQQLPLQMPPVAALATAQATVLALLSPQGTGSSRASSVCTGGGTATPRPPLGGQRIKRWGAAGTSGLLPIGGTASSAAGVGVGATPFRVSATGSGPLSGGGQPPHVVREERDCNRRAGQAFGSGSLVAGPGGAGGSGGSGGVGGGSRGGGVGGVGMLPAMKARRLSAPPPPALISEVERLLARAEDWQYDTWKLAEASQGHPLSCLGFFLMKRAGLLQRFKINPVTLARLLRHVEAGYPTNPYHNASHAADVLQTLHVIIHGAQLHVHYLDPLGLMAAYFAAIIHDYGHPGLTNDFLIATSDPLAVRYNDRSPLENHHAAAAFSVLRRPELDVTASLPPAERTAFRKQVIDLVLATDMKQHFAVLSHFNTVHRLATFSHGATASATSGPGGAAQTASRSSRNLFAAAVDLEQRALSDLAPRPRDDTERLLGLQIAMKAADLGHLGEELEVHQRWLSALEEEFFLQGDREKQLGLPVSPLFDRAKQGVGKSQVGFYDFVALPLTHALSGAFPGTRPLMRCFLLNYNHWRSIDGQPAVPLPLCGSGKQQQLQPRQLSEVQMQRQQQLQQLQP